MKNRLSRRTFNVATTATVLAAAMSPTISTAHGQDNNETLDLHVHLFGVGDNGSGCRMGKAFSEGRLALLFQHLKSTLGINDPDKTLDEQYERVLVDQIRDSALTKAAILSQDAVYDSGGKPDWKATSFFIPNTYLFEVVKRHCELMVACPSINPNRTDAIDELNRCHELGAPMLKIHPPTQNVDLLDPKHLPFFRRCQELDMIVMVHTGHEHSAPVFSKYLAAPRRLRSCLEAGCTVVACHAGSGWFFDQPDYLGEFLQLLDRFPKLWGDTAVLGTAFRFQDFGKLLDAGPTVRDRLLHGSDFPFPATPAAFSDRIGNEDALRIGGIENLIQRDFELKRSLGIGSDSAARSYSLVTPAGG